MEELILEEVGAQLVISPHTVDKHVERLRQKLSVSSRKDLVGTIGPHGLVSSAGPRTAAQEEAQ